MANFIDAVKQRRTNYALGKEIPVSEGQIVETIQTVVREVPSAFNMQSGKVVVALGAVHDRIWDITMDTLRPIVPPANFAATEQKIHSFAAAYGTVLFFDDTSIVDDLARQFPTYADNFPVWAQQANGMMQFAVWTALADLGLGVNIQHYNPLIDDEVKQLVHAPESWKLTDALRTGVGSSEADSKSPCRRTGEDSKIRRHIKNAFATVAANAFFCIVQLANKELSEIYDTA